MLNEPPKYRLENEATQTRENRMGTDEKKGNSRQE